MKGDPAEAFPDGQGERLHPVTPWRRAWAPLAGLAALAFNNPQQLRNLADLGIGPLLLVLAGILAAAALYGFLSWRVTRFLVTDTELRIRTGLLFRRSAHLRLDRIQSIDLSRPLLARLVGVAKLKMEVVGAGSSDELAFLGEAKARELRAELLARAAGITPDAARTAGEAPARQLLRVETGTLVKSLLLLGAGWGALLFLLLVAPGMYLLTGSIFATLAVCVPFAAVVWQTGIGGFLTQYDWTVSESPDGLRLDHGLLQRDHATVPPGRVQSVDIVEPLLWRSRGWARLEIMVAGEGVENGMLVPVASRAECAQLIARFLPGVSIDEAVAAVRPSPRRGRWAVPIWYRGYGHGVTETVFVARRGRLKRIHTLVPHAKVQSIRLSRGPWMHRLRLADLQVHHGGNGTAAARLMDLEHAREEIAAQAERSRLGRRSAAPERWLTGTTAPGADGSVRSDGSDGADGADGSAGTGPDATDTPTAASEPATAGNGGGDGRPAAPEEPSRPDAHPSGTEPAEGAEPTDGAGTGTERTHPERAEGGRTDGAQG
ncbi:PH domain-containing protein [Streptomyces lonarensis]|uniref:PH domain-containing protein n=1 Tax=Streptomyces lonarensis TaxID=700599 RepID=A0A7X6I0K5_9ACTN|nr:PH domain-containing protein [Streptomyces lonarensis]